MRRSLERRLSTHQGVSPRTSAAEPAVAGPMDTEAGTVMPVSRRTSRQTLQLRSSLQEALAAGNLAVVDRQLNSSEALRIALDLAIGDNNPALALLALKKGIVPDREHFRAAGDTMRPLLTYARRKHILYPDGTEGSAHTDLDRALWRHDMDTARSLLLDGREELNVREAWANAVTAGRLDVLRALLLLGEAEKDRGYRLNEMPVEGSSRSHSKIADANLIKAMKEVTYYPPKLGLPVDNNIKARDNKGQLIVCRHLAYHWSRGIDGYGVFATPESIAEHVRVSAQEIENLFILGESHIVKKDGFGRFIANQFALMAARGQASLRSVMVTTNHVMGLGLHIKNREGNHSYIVEHYDPSHTTTKARTVADHAEYFELADLDTYNPEPLWKLYFPEHEIVCTIIIRPAEDILQAHAGKNAVSPPDRQLGSPLDIDQLDPLVMWHVFRGGFASDMRKLAPLIAEMPPERQRALITVRSRSGYSGMDAIVPYGHTDALHALAELLEYLPESLRTEFILQKDPDNFHALHWAYDNAYAGVIRAFPRLFEYLPKEHYAELVAAKSPNGIHGVLLPMSRGEADTVDAFGDLLDKIPAKERAGLLLAKGPDGVSCLAAAVTGKHAPCVRAFGKLMQLVPMDDRFALLSDAVALGKDTILPAMIKQGDQETIAAFRELLDLLPDEQLRIQLLEAAHDDQVMSLLGHDSTSQMAR